MTDSVEPLVSMVTVVSLLVTVLYALIGYGFANIYKKQISREDFWVLMWLMYDALIHLTMEMPFVIISLWGTVEGSEHFTALPWKEYARADKRWGVSDPTIVSLEILTVTIVVVFIAFVMDGIVTDKYYRHYFQICLCVCELYGGWMTFCPEWLTGSPALNTSNFLFLWVYLVFFNMLWVVIPLYLLWQSYCAMKVAFGGEREVISERQETTVTTTRMYNTRSKSREENKKNE